MSKRRYLTVYQTLEPLFADYRKLRYRNMQGKLRLGGLSYEAGLGVSERCDGKPLRSIIRMDEWIDWLLREETICDVRGPMAVVCCGLR